MSARDASGSAPQHSHPHNNTMSRNENFWVDQVTPPPPPGERQGVGNDTGGRVLGASQNGDDFFFEFLTLSTMHCIHTHHACSLTGCPWAWQIDCSTV